MSIIILPTNDLVTECQSYETVFRFLAGGVKDVVFDAVLMTSWQDRFRNYRSHHEGRLGLVGYMLDQYENYLTRYYDGLSAEDRREAVTDNYLSESANIELLTMTIEDAVQEMMEDIFRTKLYNVLAEGHRWIARDLVVNVEMFPYGGRRRGAF